MKLTEDKLMEFVDELNPKMDSNHKNITTNCPSCGHREFGISLGDNHVYNCYRKKQCGISGNIYHLAKLLNKQLTKSFAVEAKQQLTSILEMQNQLKTIAVVAEPVEIILPFGYKRLIYHKYLEQRGFVEQDYHNYQVGYSALHSKLRNFVIFPIIENNLNVGYVGRNIMSKEKIEELKRQGTNILRYRNSNYTSFENLLYGYDELNEKVETVIIVEGVFDKINVDKLLQLKDNKNTKCLATFKCDISVDQMLKLSRFNVKNIILMYDNDVVHNIKKNGIKLTKYFNTTIAINKTSNDPGDMNFEELNETLDNKRDPYLFNNQYIGLKKLNI